MMMMMMMMFWYVPAIIDPNGKSLNRHNHQSSTNISPAGVHHLGDVALIQLHGGIVEVSIFRFVDLWMPQKLFCLILQPLFLKVIFYPCPPPKKKQMPTHRRLFPTCFQVGVLRSGTSQTSSLQLMATY